MSLKQASLLMYEASWIFNIVNVCRCVFSFVTYCIVNQFFKISGQNLLSVLSFLSDFLIDDHLFVIQLMDYFPILAIDNSEDLFRMIEEPLLNKISSKNLIEVRFWVLI